MLEKQLLSQVQLINDIISIEESAKERRAAGDKVPKEDKAVANLLTDAAAGKAIDGEESQAVMQAHRERNASKKSAGAASQRRVAAAARMRTPLASRNNSPEDEPAFGDDEHVELCTCCRAQACAAEPQRS